MRPFLHRETIQALGDLAPEQVQTLTSMRAFCTAMGVDLPPPTPLPSHPVVAFVSVLVEVTKINEAIIERIAAEAEALAVELRH